MVFTFHADMWYLWYQTNSLLEKLIPAVQKYKSVWEVNGKTCWAIPGYLTHWGRVTHICVGKLTVIGSDNGLSPGRRQAIIWTNAVILLIGPLGTKLSEISIKIKTFSLKKIRLKLSSAKCCSFRLGLNVLTHYGLVVSYEVVDHGLFKCR